MNPKKADPRKNRTGEIYETKGKSGRKNMEFFGNSKGNDKNRERKHPAHITGKKTKEEERGERALTESQAPKPDTHREVDPEIARWQKFSQGQKNTKPWPNAQNNSDKQKNCRKYRRKRNKSRTAAIGKKTTISGGVQRGDASF